MKDVFYNFVLFFYTKASHISGFTFQFLTYNKPRKSVFFPTSVSFSEDGFEVYNQLYKPFPHSSEL